MRNLIFVGLPGSGKSTVGRLCAKALNLPFVDADKFLEQREGRSVADIFASSGEGYFRDLESRVLAELCRRYGRALYVAEPCGHMVPDARVVVSTALSGGTLRQRLRDACRRFEARRLALDLACVRMDFSLPAPYGTGTALTPQQLTELRGRRTVFFSPELCARYFTYEQSGMTHFVLFDDADTLHHKIALGTELGIPAGFLALPEAMEALPRLLGKG